MKEDIDIDALIHILVAAIFITAMIITLAFDQANGDYVRRFFGNDVIPKVGKQLDKRSIED